MRCSISLDSAHCMNAQAASLFFEPAGMPRPWRVRAREVALRSRRHQRIARGLGNRAVLDASTSGAIHVIAWVRMLARPAICARIAWSSVKDITPGGPYSVISRA